MTMKYKAPKWLNTKNQGVKISLFIVFFIALAIIGMLLLGVIHINIIPYQRLVKGINYAIYVSDGGGKGVNEGIGFIISKIPLIGAGLVALGESLAYSIGAVLYVIMQAAKLLPKWIYRVPNVMKGVIADQGQQYTVNEKDSRTIRKAKKALNQGYSWALGYTGTIRWVAYIIDFFVCIGVYSPVKGVEGNPFSAIGGTIQAFWYQEWFRIDWFSFGLFGLATYGVEAMLKLYWAINDLRKAALKGSGS